MYKKRELNLWFVRSQKCYPLKMYDKYIYTGLKVNFFLLYIYKALTLQIKSKSF